ncbi:MAG TPA: bifunctional [glutamine synthetase] adenylyltransferase/[glutamine synthetase]-adenylyl-L-tyrosine phosphorylase, partial [Caulobacteraceae bacterium]|nr:bifunctional [glutamine synthetase] adenylyltransferase/[glutamine synthetase]-adenylyl-L-tyrosine phosphorylase [Caulobacteraceae bacterium]
MTSLGESVTACGPVVDAKAAARWREAFPDLAESHWRAVAPVFAASPYLLGLARRRPEPFEGLLERAPEASLEAILTAAGAAGDAETRAAGEVALRGGKAELHLLTALADLGGVWDLDEVTGALTRFADAAVQSALTLAARQALDAGRLTRLGVGDEGPVPGLFAIAMGKHGAFELNYSSDIDVSVFFEPEALPLADGVEPEAAAVRLTQAMAEILQNRTVDGYVFRVDLRLRPDPASTRPAVPVDLAFDYYETVGQNWERAAFIKGRAAAGDLPRGRAFLQALQPFIWRRNLDFAAIADIHSIKRQIHAYKVDERLTAAGADLKLGAGGIREIEFYVQTQQLILGGRHPDLRSPRTLDALAALAAAGHVSEEAAGELTAAYKTLRALEHRAQMIADEQTHRLPEVPAERRRIAALAGYDDLKRFDADVGALLKRVNRRYAELFAGEEALSSRFGSLVFTGVEDDPATIATLKRMGFSHPEQVAATVRGWHHGRIAATRTERGRELFTRLAPRLLDAVQATGAPDAAFLRFGEFFERLSSGVQVQSLFLAQPRLLELVVRVMAFAPQFARTLARRASALDALLDPAFFEPIEPPAEVPDLLAGAGDFEAAMDLARRLHRERAFRIGVQVLGGVAGAADAGAAFADLADAMITGLSRAALAETERLGGAFEGDVAVVALGKCGSREMTAGSDIDLMTLYRAKDEGAASAIKGWSADVFYARFTQRLVAALSAPTGEGLLYEVDLRLRPSGTKGPVAVSFAAFEGYYEGAEGAPEARFRGAETWELMALTRARVVWATSDAFAADARAAIEAALRRPRDAEKTAADVIEMRALMEAERDAGGPWDLKLHPGGLVDIEFAAQHLQLIHAAAGGPLRQNTGEALAAMAKAGMVGAKPGAALLDAWRLQQTLSQLLKVALDEAADVEAEPTAFKTLLAKAGGARDFGA